MRFEGGVEAALSRATTDSPVLVFTVRGEAMKVSRAESSPTP
jgi:hypothetical protein